jgi:exodeoxyribonuclease V alpha subunit
VTPPETLLSRLDGLADQGVLRRLGSAFARFVATLGGPSPALIVTSAVLSELEGAGHSCLSLAALAEDPCALLGWQTESWQALTEGCALPVSAQAWRSALAACAPVWSVEQSDVGQPLVLDGERLYLRRYWRGEADIAARLLFRARQACDPDPDLVRVCLDRLFDTPSGTSAPNWQKIACATAMRSHVAVITGGPGTGKTYTAARLLALQFALADDPERVRIALAAPTGKAAARLKQSIDHALGDLAHKAGQLPGRAGKVLDLAALTQRMGAARTLHNLLGARPDTRVFRHHAGHPLDIDVLIVDEASMIHLEMMAALLDALPMRAVLILLGDKDQLASVEAGAVLGDLCREAEQGGYSPATVSYLERASGEAVPAAFRGDLGELAQQTVMLRQSHRFGGPIGELASAVNTGQAEAAASRLLDAPAGVLDWMSHATQLDVLRLAVKGGYDGYLREMHSPDPSNHDAWVLRVLQAFDRFRLLCAVREGEWGVAGLNQAIEQRLDAEGLIRRRGEWYSGRPVMVTRNDYGVGVFNGDIGIALPDPVREGVLRVYFQEGEQVKGVLSTRLRDVETAYAMTVHKSQGSEFKHTVLVLPPDPVPVLTRELVYTGITRARERFTLVTPQPGMLAVAIGQRTQRASGLRDRLTLNG